MKTLLISLALLLLATPAAATDAWGPLDDQTLRTRVNNAPDPGPGEEGIVLFEGRYYRHDDGLSTLRVQRLLRIDSEWALEQVSDPRLRYDSSRQELIVHATRSFLPDGEIVDSPVNAFNEVTPGALAQAVDFLDIRELVVTHTGLVPGAIIWLDYTLRDTAPAGLPAGELIFPHGDFPLLEMEIVAEGLFGETVNPERGLHALPEPESNDDLLRWHLRELPAAPGEARHRLGDQLPHVQLSPLEDWEDVVIALAESIESAVTDTTGLGAWLFEFEVEGPLLGDWEALETWLDGMAERTALLRFDDWHWRRAPRSVARVLATSVATPLERVALLTAAMRTREIPVQWHFPRLWQTHRKQLLSLSVLDNPLVFIPTSHNSIVNWQADPVANWLVPHSEAFVRSDYRIGSGLARPAPGPGFGFQTCQVQLTQYWNLEDGAWRMEGLNIIPTPLRIDLSTPETYLREWLETDSTRVDALRLRGEVHFDAKGTTALPGADEQGLVRIKLPQHPVTLETLLPPGMNRSHSSCRAMLFPRQGADYHLTWILDLPEGMEPISLEPIGATCPNGSFTATRELEGNRLTMHYDLESGVAPVKPSDYPAFRDFVNAALDPAATCVILREREED
jgi:hypothetical protein